MKPFFTVTFVLYHLLCNFTAQAKIIPVQKWDEIDSFLENTSQANDPNTILIILDTEDILLESSLPAVNCRLNAPYADTFEKLTQDLKPQEKDYLLTTLIQNNPESLRDKQAPTLIQKWQKKGYQVIALTNVLTNISNSVSDKTLFHRRDKLQKLGFNFSKGNTRVVPFTKDAFSYAGDYPTQYHGILSTNGSKYPPGIVIGELLNKPLYKGIETVNMDSKKLVTKGNNKYKDTLHLVLYIGSGKKSLESVEQALSAQESPMPFMGFEYTKGTFCVEQVLSLSSFETFWTTQIKKILHSKNPSRDKRLS